MDRHRPEALKVRKVHCVPAGERETPNGIHIVLSVRSRGSGSQESAPQKTLVGPHHTINASECPFRGSGSRIRMSGQKNGLREPTERRQKRSAAQAPRRCVSDSQPARRSSGGARRDALAGRRRSTLHCRPTCACAPTCGARSKETRRYPGGNHDRHGIHIVLSVRSRGSGSQESAPQKTLVGPHHTMNASECPFRGSGFGCPDRKTGYVSPPSAGKSVLRRKLPGVAYRIVSPRGTRAAAPAAMPWPGGGVRPCIAAQRAPARRFLGSAVEGDPPISGRKP